MRHFLYLLPLLVLSVTCPLLGQEDGADFGMTGVRIVKTGTFPSAATVLPHSPAADAGIAPGDTILAIDGASVADLSLEDFIAKMRGKPGSEVVVAVLSHETGAAFSFTLRRVSSRAYYLTNPQN